MQLEKIRYIIQCRNFREVFREFQNCSLKNIFLKIASSTNAFQNCYHKDIFISAFMNAVKNKTNGGKSLLIMHD